MELRHLRYFIAVAEEGSVTFAAERRLHTSQPSLSRQIRDLEREVGAQLLTRTAHGVELTPAGQVFLDHARLALQQAEAAGEAARRVAHPGKPCFTLGFLTGHEMRWMPEVLRILRDELPNIDVMISSQTSPELAKGLMAGKIDAAILRRENHGADLAFRLLVREPLIVVLPSDHRLAVNTQIRTADLAGETFINVSNTAPALRLTIDAYLKEAGLQVTFHHDVDNLAMAMSLVATTRGVALLPAYAENFLPWSVTSRPIEGDAPTIDLVIGYNTANSSPVLKFLLSKVDELIKRAAATNLR